MDPINLAAKLTTFSWHSHPDTDDFFLVLKGRFTIQMREGNVTLVRAI